MDSINFCVRLDPSSAAVLRQLANEEGRTRGAMLRMLIRRAASTLTSSCPSVITEGKDYAH